MIKKRIEILNYHCLDLINSPKIINNEPVIIQTQCNITIWGISFEGREGSSFGTSLTPNSFNQTICLLRREVMSTPKKNNSPQIINKAPINENNPNPGIVTYKIQKTITSEKSIIKHIISSKKSAFTLPNNSNNFFFIIFF